MNISILSPDAQSITVGCVCANLLNTYNALSIVFENDNAARSSEELLKKMNIKTVHNDKEITVLNVSDYNINFN